MDILEVIVPYKHFHKLRQFVNVKLPPGFPVKLSELEDWVCLQGCVYGGCVCRGVSMVSVSMMGVSAGVSMVGVSAGVSMVGVSTGVCL